MDYKELANRKKQLFLEIESLKKIQFSDGSARNYKISSQVLDEIRRRKFEYNLINMQIKCMEMEKKNER